MYTPHINSVLVQIDDADAVWGGGNDDTLLGKSFSKGTLISCGPFVPGKDYPLSPDGMDALKELIERKVGKEIMWNEGHEAGTTFEEDGKLYGFIYWWDIRGVKDDAGQA